MQTLRDELAQICESRAAEVDRARTALLGMLGHDLRDPLHSISMAATMLTRSDPKGSRMGERIRSSSSRMQRLISQILDLSRLQGGLGLGMQPQCCDLSRLLLDLAEELRVAHPSTGFLIDIEPGLELQVDPDRIAQVFSNLLGNARRHGKPGSSIALGAARQDRTILIRVSNDGEPIPAELMSHLFSPFKPASVGRSSNRGGLGLGLGLYIAEQVVRGHGGEIAVRCHEGKVHFEVHLPLRPPSA